MRALGCFVLLLVAAIVATTFGGPDLPRADFVLGNGGEPRSLDPALATPLLEGRLARALFEGLVKFSGDDATPIPAAAASWTIEDDGRRYVFKLREDGRWSDGRPVVADDFVFGLTRLLDPLVESRSASQLFPVVGAREHFLAALSAYEKKEPLPKPRGVGIRATSADVLTIDLREPTPAFLYALALPSLAPLREDVVLRHGRKFPQPGALVSNGPYELVYREPRDRVRLRKNPHYRDAADVALETIDVLALDNPTTLVNLYVAGDVDWLTHVPSQLLRPLREKYPEHVRVAGMYGTYLYRVNTRVEGLRDARVRRALDLALDKNAIVETYLAGGEKPATSFTPPLSGEPAPFVRDVARARELLKEGLAAQGLSAPPTFELLAPAHPLHLGIAEAVQRQWREALGVSVRLGRMEQQAFSAAVERGDYAVARGSWIGDYPDPQTFLDVFRTTDPNNQTGFSNARYDEIATRLLPRAADPALRSALVEEATAILSEEAPVLPVYYYASTNLFRPTFEGFSSNILDVHDVARFRRKSP
jgi:oligopeptide transport system substrate-binding protein